MSQPLRETTVDRLRVRVYADRAGMGAAAAAQAAAEIRRTLTRQDRARVVFAAAPSQNEFLAALALAPGIDWARVIAFHMNEYLGLPQAAPQRFGNFLRAHLFDLVRPGTVNVIGDGPTAAADYTRLLAEAPIDLVCLGIGENGHIAFNEPVTADFTDPLTIREITLDQTSRQQQVHDGCFARLDDVPTAALTLTIPALMAGRTLVAIVPGPTKRAAVAVTLTGPIAPSCPASILRRHPDATLYLDEAAEREAFGVGR